MAQVGPSLALLGADPRIEKHQSRHAGVCGGIEAGRGGGVAQAPEDYPPNRWELSR